MTGGQRYRETVLACLAKGGCVWCREQKARWEAQGDPLGISYMPPLVKGQGQKRTNNRGQLGVNTNRR